MSWWRRQRSNAPGLTEAETLTNECQAFLDGTYLLHVLSVGTSAPAWTLVNAIAHGDIERIRDLAGESANWFDLMSLPSDWAEASKTLAGELAELVHDDSVLLTSIQKSILVPLELRLITAQSPNLAPSSVVAYTRSALRSASE